MTELNPKTSSEDALYEDSEKASKETDPSSRDFFTLPSEEHLAQITAALEYHLSDESLTHDLFLLKHIKRQPEGYVSLKLLTGYKRVKKLTRNWKVVVVAAKNSKTVQLNTAETRVKRIKPLPIELAADLPSSRSVVAHTIPTEIAKIETLAEVFSSHGSVSSIQIVKYGKTIPPELQAPLMQYLNNPTSICAIIEFEDVWGANKALKAEYESPMRVVVFSHKRKDKQHSSSTRVMPKPCHNQINKLMAKCNLGTGAGQSSRSEIDNNNNMMHCSDIYVDGIPSLFARSKFSEEYPKALSAHSHHNDFRFRRSVNPNMDTFIRRSFHQNKKLYSKESLPQGDPNFRYSLRGRDAERAHNIRNANFLEPIPVVDWGSFPSPHNRVIIR